MLYLKKMLLPDEKIVCIARLHWVIFVPGFFLLFIGGMLGLFSHEIVEGVMGDNTMLPFKKILAGVSMLISVLGCVVLAVAGIRQSSTELAITNRRIIAKYGFVARSTFEIMLNRITGVNFEQSVLGRVLNFGTILVHGAGGDVSPFDDVAKPYAFQRALIKVLGKAAKH